MVHYCIRHACLVGLWMCMIWFALTNIVQPHQSFAERLDQVNKISWTSAMAKRLSRFWLIGTRARTLPPLITPHSQTAYMLNWPLQSVMRFACCERNWTWTQIFWLICVSSTRPLRALTIQTHKWLSKYNPFRPITPRGLSLIVLRVIWVRSVIFGLVCYKFNLPLSHAHSGEMYFFCICR